MAVRRRHGQAVRWRVPVARRLAVQDVQLSTTGSGAAPALRPGVPDYRAGRWSCRIDGFQALSCARGCGLGAVMGLDVAVGWWLGGRGTMPRP